MAICKHGLPSYCCAYCNRACLERDPSAHAYNRPREDETPFYGNGSTAMQTAARQGGESTGKTLKPLWMGK